MHVSPQSLLVLQEPRRHAAQATAVFTGIISASTKCWIIVCQFMPMQLVDICSRFAHALLPQHCLLCGAPAGMRSLCDGCYADLPWRPETTCPVCALSTTAAAVCGACLKSPPSFVATIAALSYQFPVHVMLQAYKYGDRLVLAQLFGQLLADRVAATPIPAI